MGAPKYSERALKGEIEAKQDSSPKVQNEKKEVDLLKKKIEKLVSDEAAAKKAAALISELINSTKKKKGP